MDFDKEILKKANQNISKMEAIIFWYVVSDMRNVLRWAPEYFASPLLQTIFVLIREEILWKRYSHSCIKTEQLKERIKNTGYEEYFSDKFWEHLDNHRIVGSNASSATSDYCAEIENIALTYARWNYFKHTMKNSIELMDDIELDEQTISPEGIIRHVMQMIESAANLNTNQILLNAYDFTS